MTPKEAANQLRGTAQSLWDVAPKEQNDMRFCEALDAIVLQCAGCGWWCDTADCDTSSGDVFCEKCTAD